MAAAGMVLPRSPIATFPPASFSAMMPEPATVATRRPVPSASAAMRGGRAQVSRPLLADDGPGAMPCPPGHHSLTFGVPASPHLVGSHSPKPPAGSPKAFRRELHRRVESFPAGAARRGNVWRLAACHELDTSKNLVVTGGWGWFGSAEARSVA